MGLAFGIADVAEGVLEPFHVTLGQHGIVLLSRRNLRNRQSSPARELCEIVALGEARGTTAC